MCDSKCKNEACYIKIGNIALNSCTGMQEEAVCVGCERKASTILKEETIITLELMITDWKYRSDLDCDATENYSPELIKAINLLERWKEQNERTI